MLVTTLGYDDYRGDYWAVGRVFAGRIKAGQKLVAHQSGWGESSGVPCATFTPSRV